MLRVITRRSASSCDLALAAADADAADLARQMLPLPGEARQQVLQARELDLGARLAAARALVEDLEDQAAAVDHLDLERPPRGS